MSDGWTTDNIFCLLFTSMCSVRDKSTIVSNLLHLLVGYKLEMAWPKHTFDCSKKEAETCLWPGYFFSWPQEIFFLSEGEKFGIFRGNFQNPNPNQRWLTRPGPISSINSSVPVSLLSIFFKANYYSWDTMSDVLFCNIKLKYLKNI